MHWDRSFAEFIQYGSQKDRDGNWKTVSAVPEGEDKNISFDERIRQSKDKESYLGINIHDNGKGQYEFNLFQ